MNNNMLKYLVFEIHRYINFWIHIMLYNNKIPKCIEMIQINDTNMVTDNMVTDNMVTDNMVTDNMVTDNMVTDIINF